MSTQLATLEAEALRLPPEDRALLADHLLASLGSDVEDEWAIEVKRRLDEIESNDSTLVPLEQVLSRAREALK